MAGFITTDDGSWRFSFADTPEVPDFPVHDPLDPAGPKIAGYLEDPEKWKNYSDPDLYEIDVMIRRFFEEKKKDPNFVKNKYWRKYTVGMLFEAFYGRKPSAKDGDMPMLYRFKKVMAYYSTRIQKNGSVRGKNQSKSIYTLSLTRYEKMPPYSLRLRIEWLAEQGKLPTWQNMRLPKDDLKPGHARNPKTEENMRIRREKARQRYNERYKDRNH